MKKRWIMNSTKPQKKTIIKGTIVEWRGMGCVFFGVREKWTMKAKGTEGVNVRR